MSYVITLRGFVPPPRYDADPWTDARIDESAVASGPWTVLETIALAPDADPSQPARRNLTTALATIADGGWYRVTFIDADGDETSPTDPVQNAAATLSGRCGPWTSAALVAACCAGAEGDLLDQSIEVASDALWSLSGRIYSGLCSTTVRPAVAEGRCFGRWRRESWRALGLGCRAYDRLRLAGYPVRAITEVRIDADVVDPATYVLEGGRFLVRITPVDENPEGWPGCQYLDRSLGEVGTWSVTYTYGADPPAAGQVAAAALACQVYRACGGGECSMPPNVAEVIRQGVRAQARGRDLFTAVGPEGERTGIPAVDVFLAAYSSGPARRPAVWSPDVPHYPIRQEAQGGP